MSTQDQNTPQQKDARPIWARLRTKATAEEAQPHHYTRADMLKQSNIWFRKQGVPLIIPARQRALDTFPRSVPWILWAGIMHICYIFLRDILLFVVEDVKGSLPNYIKALTSDSALSNEVLPVLVLGGIFLVMPVISGVFITLAHVLMVRTPRWVQITTGILTVLFAGMLFTAGVFASNTLDGLDFVYDGGQVFPLIVIGIYLAIFLGVDTVLGWSLKHAIHQVASLPPMIAKVLPVLMVSVLFIFVNADLWKLANGLSFPRTWAVLGLMGLLAVFVVVTTSLERTARLLGRSRGDEKYARSFLKPMIERIKHILVIRDIYLGLLTMPKNEVLVLHEEEEDTEKETDKA